MNDVACFRNKKQYVQQPDDILSPGSNLHDADLRQYPVYSLLMSHACAPGVFVERAQCDKMISAL